MKIFISGYGKMGRMVEKVVLARGLEYAGWSEAVCETDKALAKECVCIDFTVPDAFRANYRFLAENFKAVVVGTT
jgi:4-hydroxy-tetrahydrodipicolinate reductase